MPHPYPPEDPRSPASVHAPFGGAPVVADDWRDEDIPEGHMRSSDAVAVYKDKKPRNTGPGPDRKIEDPIRTLDIANDKKAAALAADRREEDLADRGDTAKVDSDTTTTKESSSKPSSSGSSGSSSSSKSSK